MIRVLHMAAVAAAVGCCLYSHVAEAREAFVALIPNGSGPMGHANGVAGGPLNAFGDAFQAAGRQWTLELCQMDSDGDGATNGEELGDPCCRWLPGSAPMSTAVTVTRPGEADAFTAAQLAAMKCAEAQEVPVGGDTPREPGEEPAEEGSAGSAAGSVGGDVSWPDAGHTTRPQRSEPTLTPKTTAPPAKSVASSSFPSAAAVAWMALALTALVA